MDYVPLYALYISILSIGVSVITFVVTFIKQQRSQQFRIAIDVNDKLKETVNKFAEFGRQPHHDIEIKTAKSCMHYNTLIQWNFFSFLVRNKEITNENIINYFRPSMISEAKRIFQDYLDVAQNNNAFEDVKNMLRKWGEL
jgi:glutathione peroxidase-family protein